MTKTMTLLLASAAITAAIGVPAWSALQTPATGEAVAPLSDVFAADEAKRPVMLADSDEHEDEDEGGSTGRRESDDDDDDDCEEDEGSCGGGAAKAAAPAGAVPPPQNGLFDTGATPQVKVK